MAQRKANVFLSPNNFPCEAVLRLGARGSAFELLAVAARALERDACPEDIRRQKEDERISGNRPDVASEAL